MLVNLITWEKKNGFKAKYVAQKIGISETKYCEIKKGKRKVTLDIAYKFSEAFPEENVLELFKSN